MEPRKEMSETRKQPKRCRFQIVKLEERIAPTHSVHGKKACLALGGTWHSGHCRY